MRSSIETLSKKNPSRYTLVLALARRASEIASGSPSLLKTHAKRPSSIALDEFSEGKVYYKKGE